ncbi:MAG: hypothetical protein K0Q74_287 [Gammaproteobacteria bacterium]|jgi:hypothetical protein|nr:hypothetical protein [Gammaproteobacteria bacterium]
MDDTYTIDADLYLSGYGAFFLFLILPLLNLVLYMVKF